MTDARMLLQAIQDADPQPGDTLRVACPEMDGVYCGMLEELLERLDYRVSLEAVAAPELSVGVRRIAQA